MAYITSVEALQSAFFDAKQPFWRLYNGDSTRAPKCAEYEESDDLEASYDALIRQIGYYDNKGSFFICLYEKGGTNNGRAKQLKVKLGSEISGMSQKKSGGFYGMGFKEFMEFYHLMNNQSGESISGVAESVRAEMRLEFENDRLKRELEEFKKGGTKEKIVDSVANKLPDILDRVFPNQKRLAATIGDTNTSEDTDAPALEKADRFSIDEAVDACLKIQDKLGEGGFSIHVNDLLYKILNLLETDPSKAKIAISML